MHAPPLPLHAFSLLLHPRQQTYRDAVCAWLGEAGHQAERGRLAHFGADFAKWRWGTLHTCCQAVVKLLASIRQYMGSIMQEKLSTMQEDKETRKVVEDTFGDDLWWERLQLIATLAQQTNVARTWGSGCPCHEDLLKSQSAKSIKCVWKGRRLKEAKAYVDGRLQHFRRIHSGELDLVFAGTLFAAHPATLPSHALL